MLAIISKVHLSATGLTLNVYVELNCTCNLQTLRLWIDSNHKE